MAFEIIELKSIDELNDQIRQLPPAAKGYKRLYRGQNNDYGRIMIPSLYRGEDIYNVKDYSWKLAGQRIIKEEIHQTGMSHVAVLNDASTNFPLDGLVQHYGLRSGGLDLTSDINVALWFAQFNRKEEHADAECLLDNNKTGTFRFRKAWYDFAGEGYSYIYVFDCPEWAPGTMPKNGDCVDLNQWFGKYTARPVKQKAWYVYADNTDIPRGDLRSFVKTAFRVPNELRKEYANKTSFYFPLPADDKIYHRLLSSYFMRNDDHIFERILDIPQYYDTRDELISNNDVYTETIRVTSHYNYFKTISGLALKNPAFAMMIFDKTEYSLQKAELIKMKIPDWYILLVEADRKGNAYVPKLADVVLPDGLVYNYFIELSNCELVASKDPMARVMRGVWIVQENSRIGMQLFYYGVDKFSTSNTVWFRKTESGQLMITDDSKRPYSEIEKSIYQNSLVNALRVIQTYKNIPLFPAYIPLRLVYGNQ